MTNTAPFRNPPPGPPHDPTWYLLRGEDGWPTATPYSTVAVSPIDCALVLPNLPGGPASLADPSGRFGGLVPPPNVALAEDGTVWLLDLTRGVLRRFDDCACVFIDVPRTGGIGNGPRQLAKPVALATRPRDLLLLDGGVLGSPGRVLVFSRHGFALRAIWMPPAGVVAQPWQPTGFAVAPDGHLYVADIANGAIHVFDQGGTWRAAWDGFGAVAAIAVDRFGRIYIWTEGAPSVLIVNNDGQPIATAADVDSVCDCFAPLTDFASDGAGRINLAGRCAGAGWFDPAGNPSTGAAASPPAFPAAGTWLSTALDSRIGRCQWHRIEPDAAVPAGTALALFTFTSEVEQPIDMIAALPDSAWTSVPLGAIPPREALILSPPGRYLWLRADFMSGQQATPRIKALRVEFPRISLRRYLPAAFAPDPISGDFADRLLGIFDRGFRSVERQIDDQADLLDPRSAPAKPRAAGVPDMLTWLAGWIGATFDRSWSVPRRRQYLMQIAKLYGCRGTLPGLRRTLLLFLGLDTITVPRRAAACAANCAPPPPAWRPPPLILEHWKIRRWLYVGAGRLDDDAVLWGETIMGRSQLGTSAQLGVTKLDITRAATEDPFNAEAYAFTVFVPGGLARTTQAQSSIQRLLDTDKPAFTEAKLRFVLPRMRIGIQASIGFDSVVGCWPEGVLLDAAHLGRATVLSAAPNVDAGPRVGTARVGAGARLA